MNRLDGGGYRGAIVLVTVGLLALGLALPAPETGRTDDERDYLSAASNLARFGVVSFRTPGSSPPRSDAYREPGYPALLALSWRLAAVDPPASGAAIESFGARLAERRAAQALHALLWLLTATLAGALVARLAGGTTGALAFALVAASPALGASARLFASENLAAPLLVATALVLAAAVDGGAVRLLLAGAVCGLLPLVRASGLVVVAAAALLLFFAGRRSSGERLRRAALFLILAVVPAFAWQVRNLRQCGRFVLADRGGLALAVRAELDLEIERHGAISAALAWTPLEAARQEGKRRAPEARFEAPSWSGEGNYFSRVIRRWRSERDSGGDPLALDARLGEQAATAFLARPGAHLAATLAVGWRGLFAERSPSWLAPLDLQFGLGLLLALGIVGAAGSAVRSRDARLVAAVLPAVALFLFHALATEFLPRYGVPILPLAWSALALVLGGGARPGPVVPRSAKRH